MLKNLGILFYPSQPHHEFGAATGFIFVALIIVLLYAAMLMPMYQNMEVNF